MKAVLKVKQNCQVMNRVMIADAMEMREAGFTASQAAAELSVNRVTLVRAVGSFRRRSCITNNELDDIVSSLLKENHFTGEVVLRAKLVQRRIFVTRKQLRESIRRVDVGGAAHRVRHSLHRRVYSVPHVNFLWHADGWHRLIR
jgi:hypothetical protein